MMKRKLLLVIAALLCSIGSWAGTDYTSSMSNNTEDWTGVGSQTSIAVKTINEKSGVETYQGNETQFSVGYVLYQTISDIPNGFYTISFYAWENFADWKSDASISYGNDIAQVFANNTAKDIEVIKNTGGRDWNAANTHTLVTQVTDGTLTYGVKNINAGGNWAACKPISLTYIGTTNNLTEIIVNPSFETGDKTGWTDDTTGDKIDIISTDALSGKDGTYFGERWWHDSTMDIYQKTTNLPAGHYRITIYAKAETGNSMNLYGQAGSNSEVTQAITENDIKDYSLEVYQATAGVIKLGFKGSHIDKTHVAFDNFRLTYLGNAKGELLALQGTIDDSYLNKDTYANVGGSERTALSSAKTLTAASETAAAYETALSTVQAAIDAFVAAKDNYDALAAINAKITAVGTLTYADSEKEPSTHVGTSSSDAATYAASLTTALRAYVESNAMGEGESATNYTNKIQNATCPGPKTADDKVYSSADGWDLTYVRFDGGSGWTGFSTSHDVYYGSNGYFWGNFSGSSNVSLRQVVSDLPTGKYLLTVRAKSSGAIPTFYISGNGTKENITHPNGVFGNGWDDTSVLFPVGADGNATILLKAQKESDGTTGHWFNADNFRLVRIGNLDAVTISETATSAPTAAVADVTLTRTLSASYWNTFSVPFDMAIPSGWDVKEFDSASDNVINFTTASTIVAGKPYLVKPTSNVENPSFNGVTVQNTEGSTDGEDDYKFAAQIYNKSLATDGTIAYLATDGTLKKLTSGGIKGLRAYFIIPAGGSARIAFTDGDEPTGINEVKTQSPNGNIYDLSGRRVENMKKGIYVVNGKKVVK